MKKGKTLFILCSAAFCFTLALAGCQNANQTVVPSESETSESQSGQETTTYTVKFNSNGGSAVADQKVKKGEKAKKPTDPTREGYSFVNWFEDSALATVFDFNQAIVSDLTLYAKWDRNSDPGPGPQPEEYDYYFVCGTTKVGLIADSGTLDTNQTGQWSKTGVSVTAGQEIQFLNASNTAVQAGSDYEDATNRNNVTGSFEAGYAIHNDATATVTLKSWQDGGYSFWITGYDDGGVTPPATDYFVIIGSANYTLSSVALDPTDPENMIGKYQCQIESVSAGATIAFAHGENTIQAGSDVEDAANKNNISGSFDDGYTIHNDAADVWVTLKSWQDGGYSFWITGYDDGGVTPTNEYFIHLDENSFTLTSVALDTTDPENMTGKYQCQLSAVYVGQAVSFYHLNDLIHPGSDVEDATNKNNVNGNYDDGYTIHNDATDVYVTLKSWQDGGYSFWITGYEASTLDPTVPYGPEGSELVSWYIVGQGSLWEWSWDIDTSIQLYSNPNSSTDLGCILNVTFAVNDLFKVTDGETWYGYDKVDPWDVPGNMGLHAFAGANDSVGGENFCCTTAGTYDIYVKGDGTFWIQAHNNGGATPSPTAPYGPEGSEPVNWFIVGDGSLWEIEWYIDDSIQLYSNPNSSTDLGCILNVTFAVNDLFKVTDGETWYGYDKVDPWDVPGNMGLHAFAGANDSVGGENFCCTTAGTYDIYVKGDGTFWIQAHS